MNLDNFIKELNKMSQENKLMKEKLMLIQDKLDFVIKKAEEKEEFSDLQLTMLGIVKQLQDIIDIKESDD
jgi:hypothetical protein